MGTGIFVTPEELAELNALSTKFFASDSKAWNYSQTPGYFQDRLREKYNAPKNAVIHVKTGEFIYTPPPTATEDHPVIQILTQVLIWAFALFGVICLIKGFHSIMEH